MRRLPSGISTCEPGTDGNCVTRVDELRHRIALEVFRDAHVGLPVLDGDSLDLTSAGRADTSPSSCSLGVSARRELVERLPAATACGLGTSRATGCTLSFSRK